MPNFNINRTLDRLGVERQPETATHPLDDLYRKTRDLDPIQAAAVMAYAAQAGKQPSAILADEEEFARATAPPPPDMADIQRRAPGTADWLSRVGMPISDAETIARQAEVEGRFNREAGTWLGQAFDAGLKAQSWLSQYMPLRWLGRKSGIPEPALRVAEALVGGVSAWGWQAPEGRLQTQMTSNAMAGLAGIVGSSSFLGWDAADELAQSIKRDAAQFQLQDPSFFEEVYGSVGSAALYFIPGLGAAKLSTALKFAPWLAKIVGSTSMGILEAGSEAWYAKQDAMEKGWSEDRADKAAGWAFILNVVWNSTLDRFTFFKKYKSLPMQLLGVGIGEGTQEVGQELISTGAINEPTSIKQLLKTFAIGALASAPLGAISHHMMKQAELAQEGAPAIEGGEAAPAVEGAPAKPIQTFGSGLAKLLGRTVQELSEANGRSKEALQDFVATIGRRQGIPEEIYVPAEALGQAIQEAGLDPAGRDALFGDLGIDSAAFFEAARVGADVKFSTQALANIADHPVLSWLVEHESMDFTPSQDYEAAAQLFQQFREVEDRGQLKTLLPETKTLVDQAEAAGIDRKQAMGAGFIYDALAKNYERATGRPAAEWFGMRKPAITREGFQQWHEGVRQRQGLSQETDTLLQAMSPTTEPDIVAWVRSVYEAHDRGERIKEYKDLGEASEELKGRLSQIIGKLVDGRVDISLISDDVIHNKNHHGVPPEFWRLIENTLKQAGTSQGTSQQPNAALTNAKPRYKGFPLTLYEYQGDVVHSVWAELVPTKSGYRLFIHSFFPAGMNEHAGSVSNLVNKGAQLVFQDSRDVLRDDGSSDLPSYAGPGSFPETHPDGKILSQDTEPVNPPRGAVEFRNEQALVSLFEKGDVSTLAHEGAHIHRRDLEFLASHESAPEWVKRDWKTACDYVGAKANEAWTREQEELYATAFEKYLAKGKPPTPALRDLFRRMREWLTLVYENLKDGGVEVDPKIAEVFDRWLAGDEDVAAAKLETDIHAVIDMANAEAARAGISAEDMADYARIVQEAERDAEDRIEKRRVKELRAAEKGWKQEGRAKADEQHAMADAIVNGGGLNMESVKALYADDLVAKLSKKRPGLLRKGAAVSLEEAASQAGMDPDAMIKALLALPTKKEIVEWHVAARRKAWEGQFDAVDEVLESEAYHAKLESEAKLMGKLAGGQQARPTVQMEQALDTQEDQFQYDAGKVIDIRTRYKAALQKAQAAARKAYEQGRYEEALKQKERQRELALRIRNANRLRQDLRWTRDSLNRAARLKMTPTDQKTGVPWEYVQQIRQFAGRFVKLPQSFAAAPGTPTLEEFVNEINGVGLQQQDGSLYVPGDELDIPPVIKGLNKPLHKMTRDELAAVRRTVQQLEHVGRNSKKLIAGGIERDLQQVVNTMMATVKTMSREQEKDLQDTIGRMTGWQKAGKILRRVDAHLLRMEFVLRAADKGKAMGAWWSNIFAPIAEARTDELRIGNEVAGKLAALYEKFTIAERRQWTKMTAVSGVEQVWTIEQMIMMALNSGTKNNRKTVLAYGDVNPDWLNSQEYETILNYLNDRHWDFVEGVWDIIDSLWPMAEKTYFELKGVKPVREKGITFTLANGRVIQGRYFPIKHDQRVSEKARNFSISKALEAQLRQNLGQKPQHDPGYMIARVGAKIPTTLNIGVMFDHIDTVIHESTHGTAIRDAAKILDHPAVKQTMREVFGPAVQEMSMPWLHYIKHREILDQTNIVTNILEGFRKNMTVALLSYRLMSVVKQFAAIPLIPGAIGSRWALEGLFYFVRNPAQAFRLAADIRQMSPEIAAREKTFDRDLGELKKSIEPFGKDLREKLCFDWGLRMLGMADSIPVYITWAGAFQRAMKAPESIGLKTPDMDLAIAYANERVRTSQPTSNPMDLPAIQRAGGPHRILAMFYTPMSVIYNVLRERTWLFTQREAAEPGKKQGKRMVTGRELAAVFVWYSILPQLMMSMFDAIKKREWPTMKDIISDLFLYHASTVPVVREVASMIINGYDFKISPAYSGLAELSNMGLKLARGDIDQGFVESTLMGAGGFTGFPSLAVIEVFRGAMDLANNVTDNPLRLFMGRSDEERERARRMR